MIPSLIDTNEVAALLRCTRSGVIKLVRRGEGPP